MCREHTLRTIMKNTPNLKGGRVKLDDDGLPRIRGHKVSKIHMVRS